MTTTLVNANSDINGNCNIGTVPKIIIPWIKNQQIPYAGCVDPKIIMSNSRVLNLDGSIFTAAGTTTTPVIYPDLFTILSPSPPSSINCNINSVPLYGFYTRTSIEGQITNTPTQWYCTPKNNIELAYGYYPIISNAYGTFDILIGPETSVQNSIYTFTPSTTTPGEINTPTSVINTPTTSIINTPTTSVINTPTTSVINTPGTSEINTPGAVTTNEINTPGTVTTNEINTPGSVTTNEINTPGSVTTSVVTTNEINTPTIITNLSTNNVWSNQLILITIIIVTSIIIGIIYIVKNYKILKGETK